jgi:hypothetical protein
VSPVEFKDPFSHVVEKVTIMGNAENGAWIFAQVPLKPRDGLSVEMVSWLVEEEYLWLFEEQLTESDTTLLSSREIRDA